MTFHLLLRTHKANDYSVSVVDAFATEQMAIDFVRGEHPDCEVQVTDYPREHCFIRKVATVTGWVGQDINAWKCWGYQVLEMQVQGAGGIVSRSAQSKTDPLESYGIEAIE